MRTTAHRLLQRAATGAVLAVAVATISSCTPSQGTTARVSTLSGGVQMQGASGAPAIAPDGRFVAFSSRADVPGEGEQNDSNLWLKDRANGITFRVNEPPPGVAEDPGGTSDEPSVANHTVVAFSSSETNLVPGFDANGRADDVFLRTPGDDLRLVSVAIDGGRGNEGSGLPSVSADGRFVAFQSQASDLVVGDTNQRTDIFVRDMQSSTTRRASVTGPGGQLPVDSTHPSISADGTRVAFLTEASLSGRDVDGRTDAYVKDLVTGELHLVSSAGSGEGTAREVDLAGDGRRVAFITTTPSGIDQALVTNLTTGAQTLLSHQAGAVRTGGNRSTTRIAMSSDGTHVAFSSRASDLVSGDSNGDDDYFVATSGGTGVRRVSVRTDGGQSRGHSAPPDVSNDGQVVVFMTDAPDLVPGDTNGTFDAFAHVRR